MEYPEHHHVRSNTLLHDCQLNIKNLKADMYKSVRNKMIQSQQTVKHHDCIVDYLKSEFWAENKIKYEVYDASSQLPVVERRRVLSELLDLSERQSSIAVNYCLHENDYGSAYDELANVRNETEVDRVMNYCCQKFVIEHGMAKDYEVNLTNTSTNTINCNKKIKEFKDDIENGLVSDVLSLKFDASDDDIDCIMRVQNDENYTEKMIQFSVIARLNLTEAANLQERKSFIKFLSLVTHEISKCF